MGSRFVTVFALLGACTFNVGVEGATRDATTSDPLTGISSDLRGVGFRNGHVMVTGSSRSNATATATVGALVGGGSSSLRDRLAVSWAPVSAGIAVLSVGYGGAGAETTWLEVVDVEVPSGTDVTLQVAGADVGVAGTTGRVEVTDLSGDIEVTGAGEVALRGGAGDIVVDADGGSVVSEGGDVTMTFAHTASVRTGGGAIVGAIGDTAELESDAGAIDVSVSAALAELTVRSMNGAITVRVPVGASLVLDLESTHGPVHVAAGGVTFDGSGVVRRTLGAGGPVVTVRSTSGRIEVVER